MVAGEKEGRGAAAAGVLVAVVELAVLGGASVVEAEAGGSNAGAWIDSGAAVAGAVVVKAPRPSKLSPEESRETAPPPGERSKPGIGGNAEISAAGCAVVVQVPSPSSLSEELVLGVST